MRISKAIREYVEEEIRKKYYDAADEIGKEYYEEKNEAKEMVLEIMRGASAKAEQYLKDLGYNISMGYKDDCMFYMSGSFSKEIEGRINAQRNDITCKWRDKARKVLFDLEMGDANKKELREILDNITVD